MGTQITAVVKEGDVLNSAPYELFANNVNVVAYNKGFEDMYADKEFCEIYNVTGNHVPVSEIRATSSRRTMLNFILGISFEESVQSFTPDQVKKMSAKLQEAKDFNLAAVQMLFNMNEEDYISTIEFFEIAAQNELGIVFA